MNKINLPQTTDHFFLKTESFLSKSSNDKKITFIALVIFSGLAIYYTLRYCFREWKKEHIQQNPPPSQIERDSTIDSTILDENVISSIEGIESEKDVSSSKIKEQFTDPFLLNYTLLDQEHISELAETVDDQQKILNTGMTNLLQNYTFSTDLLPYEELNQFLEKLAIKAISESNKTAQLALTRPNNHEQLSLTLSLINAGFPQNTPLILLVKAGNLDGVKIILEAYQREDLLFSTPRGNTALHLAILTGQINIALAIANRARELDCFDSLMEIKNKVDQTPEMMYDSLIKELISNDKRFLFRPFLDYAEPLLGGEEVNKAIILKDSPTTLGIRNSAIDQLKKTMSLTTEDLCKLSFIEIANLTATRSC